ncbi:hypothetical protein N9V64_00250 [Candidatus Pelagibacter bacterium]|nr:hypothetical protein [Candidatus Pelagibacter bacterium]
MALKPCRECKKKVSTEALTCPSCGVPNPTIKSIKKDKRVNIQHGVEYCSNCGTELPSGPPCNNPRCRLAEISSQKKNKSIVEDQYNVSRKKAENEVIDKYFGGRSASNNKRDTSSKGDGFWNGTEGLAKTFWLYFIVGNMIGNLMVLGAASEGIGLVYFVIFVTIVWNIFAIMGVFNAADIYKAEKIKIGTTYGYATAAKIGCVVLILSSIGNAL